MSNGREKQKGIRVQQRDPGRLLSWPEEIERFFDRPVQGFGLDPWLRLWRYGPRFWRELLPDIDVFEREGKFVVRADLPGVQRDDIDVAIEGSTLVIRGQRKEEREVRDEDYYRSERAAGAFSRVIRLPEGTDNEHIEATYQDGVLEVMVPLAEAPKAKKVEIQVK